MLDELSWPHLRALVSDRVLRAPRPWLSAPALAAAGRLCDVCRGPVGPGRALCFQCGLHRECAQASLADLVVPVAFAVKGDPLAACLWQYKSARLPEPAREATAALLRALLLLFLRDHGPCIWREAGIGGPTQLAVVPTGRRRQGPHPLRLLVEDYLDLPWAGLTLRPGEGNDRELNPLRYSAPAGHGEAVLLLDDTWTTGASAQSAAMALRASGARSVVVVVLGRHLTPAIAEAAGVSPEATPYRPGHCAVHLARDPAPLSRADLRLDP